MPIAVRIWADLTADERAAVLRRGLSDIFDPALRASIAELIDVPLPAAFESLFVGDVKKYLEPLIRAEMLAEMNADPAWASRVAAVRRLTVVA